MKLKALPLALFALFSAATLVGCVPETDTETQTISLTQEGRYLSGIFDASAAEIVTFDETTNQSLVVNAQSGKIDVLGSTDITNPILNVSIDLRQDLVDNAYVTLTTEVGASNSVTSFNGLMAVAVEANPKTDTGWVMFYKTSDMSFIKAVEVGYLPDMLTFTPDGSKVIVACEAEPTADGDYSIDPEGSVSIISTNWDGAVLTTAFTNMPFTDFNVGGSRHSELPGNLLLNGYQASVAQDLEPEYIAISADSTKAFVGLQENNAYAEIDLTTNNITAIRAFGFKDHSIAGNELDGNNKDDAVDIKTEPALGMYMPDSIATMSYNDKTYLLTANEGDDRADWILGIPQGDCEANDFYWNIEDGICADDITMKDALDTGVYDPADPATKLDFSQFDTGGPLENAVQRIKFSHSITKQFGDTDSDGKIDKMLTFGARSFSIWDTTDGSQVYDSGKDFEQITSDVYGADFNQTNDENKAEDRSDNKGPEPEALTVGVINGKTYAFIGLERMGGIMVYDVTNPYSPTYIEYLNNRDITIVIDATTGVDIAGDLGPEGMKFVDAAHSPSGKPMLIVASEVSGTTTFYNIEVTVTSE
jgi:hypothetical protein